MGRGGKSKHNKRGKGHSRERREQVRPSEQKTWFHLRRHPNPDEASMTYDYKPAEGLQDPHKNCEVHHTIKSIQKPKQRKNVDWKCKYQTSFWDPVDPTIEELEILEIGDPLICPGGRFSFRSRKCNNSSIIIYLPDPIDSLMSPEFREQYVPDFFARAWSHYLKDLTVSYTSPEDFEEFMEENYYDEWRRNIFNQVYLNGLRDSYKAIKFVSYPGISSDTDIVWSLY